MRIACIAPGPSLTRATCERLVGRLRVLAVSNAFELCPEADWLYACDYRWWREFEPQTRSFGDRRYSGDLLAVQAFGLQHLKILPQRDPGAYRGLCREPFVSARGHHGGYQALNLALHLGATEVWLIGYDLRVVDGRDHFFGEYRQRELAVAGRSYARWAAVYNTVQPADYGLRILNMTPGSAITAFPFGDLDDALRDLPAAA